MGTTTINLFWMQRDYINNQGYENIRERIIDFWRWLYNKYKSKEIKEEDKKILSHVIKLAAILPELNEEYFEWLMLSAPNVNIDYNSSFLIEYLNMLKDKTKNEKTAEYIGKIFLQMLTGSNIIPDYNQEHIKAIVEFIYTEKKQDLADKICNIYGKNGYLFLREIFNKYQK